MTTTTQAVTGHLVDISDLNGAIESLSGCIAKDVGLSLESKSAAASIRALCKRINVALDQLCEIEEERQ